MGLEPPVDAILASAVAFLTPSLAAPLVALSHRSGRSGVQWSLLLTGGAAVLSTLLFASPGFGVFDHAHPKRLPVLHMQNLSSSPPAYSLHVASLDRAAGFPTLVHDMADAMGLDSSSAVQEVMAEDVPYWDIICECRCTPRALALTASARSRSCQPISRILQHSYPCAYETSAGALDRFIHGDGGDF